jgi:hypothetical protein
LWPAPQSYGVEIHVPVVSTSHFGGTNATGIVTLADGNNNPTLMPEVLLPSVGTLPPTHTAGPPSVTMPQVSNITDHSARVQALIVNNYTDGFIETNYGSSAGPPYTYSLGVSDYATPRTYQVSKATTLTGLQPGCTYHWNVDFRYYNGASDALVQIADQTFTTTGSNTGTCAIDPNGGSPPPGSNTSFSYVDAPNSHGSYSTTLGTGGTTPPVTIPIPTKDPSMGGQTPDTGPASPAGGGTPTPTVTPAAFTGLTFPSGQHGHMLKLKLTIGVPGSLVTVRLYDPVKKKQVLVGKLSHAGVGPGLQRLNVPLNSAGKKLLRAHKRLKLTVKLAVTPPGGVALKATRKVTLKR